MSDNTPVETLIPVISLEHRNAVLLLQRQSLSLRMNMMKLQSEMDQLPNVLNTLLSKIFTEMGLDVNAYVFDLESLELKPKV